MVPLRVDSEIVILFTRGWHIIDGQDPFLWLDSRGGLLKGRKI